MALINNLYVCATSEEVNESVSTTEHPVESGLPLTDNVRRNAMKLSVSGYIVDSGSMDASSIADKLSSYSKNGQYVQYVGRVILSNALITDFTTQYSNAVSGGCQFSMTIQEIRVAKSATNSALKRIASQKQITYRTTTTTTQKDKYHIVKKGDCLWNIAKRYYGTGTKYPKIYEANKVTIDNRNKGHNVDKYTIYPNQKLLIP